VRFLKDFFKGLLLVTGIIGIGAALTAALAMTCLWAARLLESLFAFEPGDAAMVVAGTIILVYFACLYVIAQYLGRGVE